jgi:hypothetical protein
MAAPRGGPHAVPMTRARHDRPAAVPALWAATLLCALAFAGVAFALLLLLHPAANAKAPAVGTSADVGGVVYTSPGARPLDPRIHDDAVLLRGAPRATSRDLWFAAFVNAANDGARPAAMARRIVLRDVTGDRFRPVALPASNRFRYRARTIPPSGAVPRPSSPAGSDLAAGGELLLYRIPRSAYESGPLQLQFTHGGRTKDLTVADGGGADLSG